MPGGPDHSVQSDVVIRRTPTGWLVEGGDVAAETQDRELDDLHSAMVLADLLVGDIDPGARPPRPTSDMDEAAELKLMVKQLEHALHARVVIEQAIGVVAERQHLSARDSFERLRRVARSHGRKVHSLAQEVVASVTDANVPLPPELVAPHH